MKSAVRRPAYAALLFAVSPFAIAPIALGLATSATAQNARTALSGRGEIAGTVTQASTGAPLRGVSVSVEGHPQSTVTDSQGRFRFGNLPAGQTTLSVNFLGYEPVTQAVDVPAGGAAAADVALAETSADILVVGQRGAQARALSDQRSADNLRNVVSADQAGRFPDLNAAESLRRVPGVSIQREVVAGDGRYISIRGLDSGLNNTQINGMNAAQPEKENRRVPLDMVQTSALSRITVHKTLLPDQEADGIGGAVELETATAFDFNGPVIDLTISGYMQELRGNAGPILQGTVATRFGPDDRFGVLFSGAYAKRRTKGFVFYQDEDYLALVEDDPSQGVTPLQYHQTEYETERETISANLAFNWAVSDGTEFTLKGSFNRLYDKELSRAIYFEAGTDEYDEDGRLITTEPGSANIFNQYEETELTQHNLTFAGKSTAGALTIDYGAGWSQAIREEPFDNEVAFTRELESNLMDYGFEGGFALPNLTPADLVNIANPDGYELGYNDIDIDDSRNSRWALHTDLTWEPSGGAITMVRGGLKFERSVRKLYEANVMELTGPLTLNDFGQGRKVSARKTGAPYPDWISLDINRLKAWRDYSQSLIDADPENFVNEYVEDGAIPVDEDSYRSREDRIAGYAMAKGVWGDVDVVGGLRIDHTRVESSNFEAIELAGEDRQLNKVTGRANYTSVLPRVQMNWRPSADLVLRAAMFTSIARPEPLLISGATEIEEDDGVLDVTIGNPGLRPAYAWNFDLSVERYFQSIGVISAGIFWKRIDGFIFSQLDREVDGDTSQFENDPRFDGREIGSVTTFANGKNADIYGLELNFVRQFPELPGALGGLGVYANATFQRSNADTGVEEAGDSDFFNAPETILNAALTYQKYGVEGTFAYSWRDRQIARFSSYFTRIVEEPYGSFDLQLSFQATREFKVFFNAVDLFNSGKDPIVDERYGSGSELLEGRTHTGRNFTFGVNLTF